MPAPLLSVADARAAVLAELSARPASPVPLAGCRGLCLSEPAAAAADSPPFAKATMDGFAVRSADCAAVPVTLAVIEEVPAGSVPTRPVGAGECCKIMTGAPLPDGADAVIPVEVSRRDGGRVTLSPNSAPRAGAAVMARGAAVRAGQTVVPAGVPLTPAMIGALAEHGFDPATAVPPPRVAVLSTGDEVVPAAETPGPGQIRDANGPLLAAAAAAVGAVPVPLGPVGDDRAALAAAVREGLSCDALLVAGGVSAGDFDLVPGALADCGVRSVFHGVNVKPGKPLWFGVFAPSDERRERRERGVVPVFGLPGNPVSSLTGFELFVRPALRRLAGFAEAEVPPEPATLAAAVANRGDRPLYRPVALTRTAGGLKADPVNWAGSGDLRGAAAANGAALIAGGANLAAGDAVEVVRWCG